MTIMFVLYRCPPVASATSGRGRATPRVRETERMRMDVGRAGDLGPRTTNVL